MKRFAVLGVQDVAVMGLFAQSALAAEPHLKGRNPIAFTDNGLDLTARVSYAGLGNFDSLQVLTATGGTVSMHEPGWQPGTRPEPRAGYVGGSNPD